MIRTFLGQKLTYWWKIKENNIPTKIPSLNPFVYKHADIPDIKLVCYKIKALFK